MNRSPASIKQDSHSSFPSRQFWPDLLRIVAAFAVVFLHVSASRITSLLSTDPEWWTVVACRVLPSFAVPVFFMLSGMFLLDPARLVDAKKIFHACWRFMVAFAFWSTFYALAFPPHHIHLGQFLKGPVHLWFLPALASCYLVAPALRAIARDRKAEEALLVAVFFLLCVPSTLRALSESFRRVIPTTISVLSMPVFLVLLGDYLHRFPPCGLWRNLLFSAGGGGLLFCICATGLFAKDGHRADFILGAGHAHIVLFSAAIFTIFQSYCAKTPTSILFRQVVSEVAKDTFGVYLVHVAFIRILPTFFGSAVLDIVARSIVIFMLSLVLTAILRRIPGLKLAIS